MANEDINGAINYLKAYRKIDEKTHNMSPKDSVAYFATNKCLKYWDMAIQALEQGDILQEIWNKTYGLHPINRGDNDYANGVYDGMCRVIDIVCNTIDSKIKELSE